MIHKFMQSLSADKAMTLINYWPPYIGAGIKVSSVSDDKTKVTVTINQRFYNTNYVGVHFGGNLYSMSDPFYMFLLKYHLGNDYIVWDKKAEIDFLKPGVGKLRVEFEVSLDKVQEIKKQAESGDKVLPVFETYILNSKGEKVSHVKKTLYVRKKANS